MRFALLIILGCCYFPVYSQSINRVEYFVDIDPGYGKGEEATIGNDDEVSFTIDTENYSLGIHTLYVRAKDDEGWSTTYVKRFLVEEFIPSEPSSVNKAEYFFNEDPGFDKGTDIPFSPGIELDITFPVDISSLNPGLHTLYIRTRDQKGRWNMTYSKKFLIGEIADNTLSNIDTIEYFFDTDPGYGQGTPITFSSNIELTHTFSIELPELESGVHYLYIRAKDQRGKWGTTMANKFLVEEIDTGPLANIDSVEYFIDEDPGYGNAIPVNDIEPATEQSLNFIVDLTEYDFGYHTLYVRAKDENGRWGSVYITTFSIGESPEITKITPNVASPGNTVTIRGSSFNPVANENLVKFDTIGAEVVEAAEDALVVTVPEGFFGYTYVTVTTNNFTATSPERFRIIQDAPYIASIVPASGKADDIITLTGENFSEEENRIAVRIGGKRAEVIEATETSVQVKVPDGVGGAVAVSLSVRGITIEASSNFIVLAPNNNLPPQIIHTPLVLSCVDTDALIVADVIDQTNRVSFVNLYYRNKGSETYEKIVMHRQVGDTYQAAIPAAFVTNAGTEYYIEALDDYQASTETSVYEITIQDEPLLKEGVTNMLPADGAQEVDLPLRFSWAGSPQAVAYDLYLWPNGEERPTVPTVADITELSTIVRNINVSYGSQYSWQIVAKDACTQVPGPVQNLTFRSLPDLTVSSVIAPGTAFSEETIEVEWVINNAGQGNTGDKDWYEGVYLSLNPIFNVNDAQYIKGLPNVKALSAGEDYTQTTSITLPRGIQGDYYIFISVDAGRRILEGNENNNVISHSDPIEVKLKPPPDLQVTSIAAPLNSFSDEPIDIRWQVANKGTGNTETTEWTDVVYISATEEFNSTSATQLGVFMHQGALAPEESYERTASVIIPRSFNGTYYFFVRTDTRDRVFEPSKEDNNTLRSDSINVILTPPPDLVVKTVTARDTASANEAVSVTWEVENQGTGIIEDANWSDRVFLSTTEDGSSDIIHLSSKGIKENLDLNAIYSTQASITIPRNIVGDYYIFVKTDVSDNLYEHEGEGNNITRSEQPIHITTPDLTVENIVVPETGNSGQIITIEWEVVNIGPGALINRSWRDQIYLSPTPTVGDDVIELTASHTQSSIVSGASIDKSIQAQLPQGIEGAFYIVIATDPNDQVFENGQESNNVVATSESFTVNLSDWADLQVDQFTIPEAAYAGDPLELNFTVKNQGKADAFGMQWIDRIYMSVDSVWNPNRVTRLASITRSQGLTTEGSYTVEVSALIPMLSLMEQGLDSTSYCYVYIVTDSQNDVYEYTDEDNNITRSNAIFVTCPPPVDLHMDWVRSNKNKLQTGEQLSVEWRVTNRGSKTGFWYYELWYDGIYLSKDKVWDSQDIFVTDQVIYGPLEQNAFYRTSLNVRMPDGISGEYFLLVVADHKDKTNEGNFDDNYLPLAIINEEGEEIPDVPYNIIQTASPDLVIESYSAPVEGIAGQPIKIAWSISNQGDTVTTLPVWTDIIYLSSNFILEQRDRPLGTRIQQRKLAIGEEYKDTLEVFLPSDAEGNYVLIFKTDARNTLYEHEGEGNNIQSAQIFITKADPSDLVVTDIVSPDTIVAGEEVSIQWKLRNLGENLASGYTSEGVFLSADSIIDSSDTRLGTHEGSVRLAPMGDADRSLSVYAENIALGTYYLIVQGDLKNNIFETDEENNITVASKQAVVTMPTLQIGATLNDELSNGLRKHYHLHVPDSLDGETLLLTLEGADQAVNTLFLRYGDVPNQANYDFKFDQPASPNQQITVPTLMAGDYYVLITGQHPKDPEQAITVSTKIIPFEIRVVDANQGGNSGMVTVKMEGAKFVKGMMITLESEELGTIPAVRYELKDGVTLFATFDLRGAKEGVYDVKMEKADGTKAIPLNDGFEVVAGLVKGLIFQSGSGGGGASGQGGQSATKGFVCCDREVNFDNLYPVEDLLPLNTRINRIVPMTFYVENNGNVDIPVPEKYLISLEGAPLGYAVDELEENKQEVFLVFREKDGPQHVLRPGAQGSVTIYTKATTRLRFQMID